MKRFLAILLAVMLIGTMSVSAENPYGFNDEIMEFLNENNVDVSIFLPIFNYNEYPTAEVVKPVEDEIYRIRVTAYSYGWTDIQIRQMLEGYINTTLKWMYLEYAYIPKCKVTLNGQEFKSEYRQYPLLQFRDIIYFPMTYYDSRFLGIGEKYTEDGIFLYGEIDMEEPYHDYLGEQANKEKYPVSGMQNVHILNGNVNINGTITDNEREDYPLLWFREIIYFPLTWEYAVEEFGWEYSFDNENGLVINSK